MLTNDVKLIEHILIFYITYELVKRLSSWHVKVGYVGEEGGLGHAILVKNFTFFFVYCIL